MQPVDWAIMGLYGLVVLVIGWRVGRGHQTTGDFVLGGRRIPAWAVFLSLVATELSAATFIGTPHGAYQGSWSYLQFAFGALVGKLVVGVWFIRLYYRLDLVTVYGLLGHRFGPRSQLCAAWFFLVGRVLASGARLFIASLAFATVTGLPMEVSILAAGTLAGTYTLAGGIRAVIWTDVLQGFVFLVAAVATLAVLFMTLDGGAGALWGTALAAGKLDVFGFPPLIEAGTPVADVWSGLGAAWEGFVARYLGSGTAFVTAFIGGLFVTLAAMGTDQDMVQRLLTARSSRKGAGALMLSGLTNFPLVALFLLIGTGIWAWYHSDLGPGPVPFPIDDAKQVFPFFVLHQMPTGLRGLVFTGLFAAAMSSLDSAVNALATTWVSDVRRPAAGVGAMRATRGATLVFTLLLMGAALFCASYFERRSEAAEPGGGISLVEFALAAMAVVYGGLLGGFLVALMTPRRGTDGTVLLGMIVGGAVGMLLFLQPYYIPDGGVIVAWSWWIPIGALIAFGIGVLKPTPGRRAS